MSTLELFGDWIYFDGERLAKIPDWFPPGRRMLLEEHMAAQGGTVDMTDEWSATVLIKNGTVLYEVIDDRDQPPLPTGTTVKTVIYADDLQDKLDELDIKLKL